MIELTESEIAAFAVQKARVRYPRANAFRLYLEAKRIARTEHKAGSWTLILSLIWPMIVELFWRR